MSFLRKTLDRIEPHVSSGGKYPQFYALYEAVDTVFYSPSDVNKGSNHVRDGIDLKARNDLCVVSGHAMRNSLAPIMLAYRPIRLWRPWGLRRLVAGAATYWPFLVLGMTQPMCSTTFGWAFGTGSQFTQRCLSLVGSGRFCLPRSAGTRLTKDSLSHPYCSA